MLYLNKVELHSDMEKDFFQLTDHSTGDKCIAIQPETIILWKDKTIQAKIMVDCNTVWIMFIKSISESLVMCCEYPITGYGGIGMYDLKMDPKVFPDGINNLQDLYRVYESNYIPIQKESVKNGK